MLVPAQIEREPAKRVRLGGAVIRAPNGRETIVDLFSSEFQIGETYYRYPDGNSKEIMNAIRAAQSEASNEQP